MSLVAYYFLSPRFCEVKPGYLVAVHAYFRVPQNDGESGLTGFRLLNGPDCHRRFYFGSMSERSVVWHAA